MPKIEYKSIKFQQKSLELIKLVNQVVEEYQAQGYELTLRQAYYQLVARGYIPNNERSYKNIGNLINDGRLAGLIDWHSITDRTRNLRRNGHWDNPADVIASARYSYLLNKWDGQPNYVEVWVEKDALVDIVGQACTPLDTPYFSCRGYTSQSEMWSAAQRFISQDYRDNRVIIHLGDHDPMPQNSVITLNQSVFRNEGRLNWEEFGRLRDYHVREIVFLGTQEFVEQTRENIREEVMTFIRKMNMDAYITVAADAFIMPKMIKYKKYQKMEKSKYEVRVSYDKDHTLAAASLNLHGTAFTSPFHIKVKGVDNPVSGCVGFGIERWILVFLAQYGTDSACWPDEVKKFIRQKG